MATTRHIIHDAFVVSSQNLFQHNRKENTKLDSNSKYEHCYSKSKDLLTNMMATTRHIIHDVFIVSSQNLFQHNRKEDTKQRNISKIYFSITERKI